MNAVTYRLIDTHAHLDELDDLDTALEKAREAGVAAVIAVGQEYESNLRTLAIADKHRSFVYPALGLHPWSLGDMDAAAVDRNLGFIQENIRSAVALGEVGLDYHKRVRAAVAKERQMDVLRALLEIARANDKPVSLHSRYAWKDGFDLVKESGAKKVVFHWYTGFSSVLRHIIAEGYFVSATPAAGYHDEHRRAVKEAPLENLLLETDTPVTYGRQTRFQATPADTTRSLEAVAEAKGLDRGIVAEKTTSSAATLFGLW
jgi:TatD DNase family protein